MPQLKNNSAPSPLSHRKKLWRWLVPTFLVVVPVSAWYGLTKPNVVGDQLVPEPSIGALFHSPGSVVVGDQLISEPSIGSSTPDKIATARLSTSSFNAQMAAQNETLNPAKDGWQTEVFGDASKVQLERITKWIAHTDQIEEKELHEIIADNFICGPLRPALLKEVFRDSSIVVLRPSDESALPATDVFRGFAGFAHLLTELAEPFSKASDVHTKVKIVEVDMQGSSGTTKVLLETSGETATGTVETHVTWHCEWVRRNDQSLRLKSIRAVDYEEIIGHGHPTWFADCTQSVLGNNESFHKQLTFGLNHWLLQIPRDVTHIFFYGMAVGDANGDGLDDIYLCQPGGLPNRLYLQNPDGTATDKSESAQVDILDSTVSALFVDLDNDSDQDLVIAAPYNLLVFENDSEGRFRLKADLETADYDVTSLSAVDYDLDGDLDLYICIDISTDVALGEDTSTPFVYHDSNNGAPNAMFRNDIAGDSWRFANVTKAVGLDANNRRHSLAAAWEDYDNDGDMDLYVGNDFGKNCLYRNDGGRFVEIASEAGVVDHGAAMSVDWGDFNHDGLMDLYVSNMFSAAGNRITRQAMFQPNIVDPAMRALYLRFAKGNTLLQNLGNGRFREVSATEAVEMGRWAWSSVFLDLNNDSWEDLFVANGYVTNDDSGDL